MSTVQTSLNTEKLFEPLLTSHGVAPLLRIHQKTLESMARAGLVPATKKGMSWVFRLTSLSAWIDQELDSNLGNRRTRRRCASKLGSETGNSL
jgi:hypothetical protein